MKRHKAIATLTFIVLMNVASAQDFFETSLAYGAYPVGFNQISTTDFTRPPLSPPQHSNLAAAGREMKLFIWYPAVAGKNDAVLFSDYVAAPLPENERTNAGIRSAFLQRISELSGDSALFVPFVNRLLSTQMKAKKAAPIAPGKFPILIFPDNPYGQSILCEYLASHGFLVVSPEIKGTYATPIEYNERGIEAAVDDLKYALGFMREHFTTSQSFGVMGIGFNATTTLALQMQNTDVGAFISLEGGITTGFEEALLTRTTHFDLQRCTAPMLIIHAPHPDVKPQLTYKYQYADRIYQRFPQSSEFYFLNFGIWEKHLKNIFPKSNKGNTWQSFETAAASIKHFLDWRLKSKMNAKQPVLNVSAPNLVETSYIQAKHLPPTDEELLTKLEYGGIKEIGDFYYERKKSDAQPFTFGSFFTVGQKLIQNAAFNDLLRWAQLFEDSYPESALPYSMQGRAYLEAGKNEEARVFYTKALHKMDADAELNAEEKKSYRQSIVNRLNQLKGALMPQCSGNC